MSTVDHFVSTQLPTPGLLIYSRCCYSMMFAVWYYIHSDVHIYTEFGIYTGWIASSLEFDMHLIAWKRY